MSQLSVIAAMREWISSMWVVLWDAAHSAERIR
jgi:hypothetical protein